MPKHGRRRQDHLARQARSEGYHARSIYKLEAIQRKFHILIKGSRVLDLGAAPGSWTQYVVEQGGAGTSEAARSATTVLAVDLQEMSVAGATCVQGDFTEPDIVARITGSAPFDLIMSDAAPATTGNRLVDTGRSEALVESILARLRDWLAPGGNLVCKLFQGGGEQDLLRQIREQFRAGHLYRPDAVRRESFETYLVGIGYRADVNDQTAWTSDPNDRTTAEGEG